MTKENEKLRDCLRDAESIITNALRSQPEGDNECKIHLTKAVKDILGLVYDAKSQMPDGSKYAMEGMGHPSAYDRPSNTAAMREALSDACYAMFNFLKTQQGGYEEMANALDKAKAALSAPPRNCDVGTHEEQAKRFDAFCGGKNCLECPHFPDSRCELAWAQDPYEKGGEK